MGLNVILHEVEMRYLRLNVCVYYVTISKLG